MEAMGSTPSSQYRSFHSPWVLWIVWIIWLPFLIPNVIQLLRALGSPAAALALAGNAVFVFLYCFFSFRMALKLSGRPGDEERIATVAVASLLLLAVGIEILGTSMSLEPISLYTYTVAYAGSAFAVRRGIITNSAVLAIALGVGAFLGLSLVQLVQTIFLLLVVSFMTMNWTRSIIVSRKLHEAQGEIARLAAADERLRIARDLHDLLGQKLSFIALKSELARHLVSSAPDRAETEIAEVESTVRSTLQEVREAVAGYRRPDLARELHAAAELLSAAGIRLDNRYDLRSVEKLSLGLSEALAWAVREGVTNVIRHSRAKTCVIDLTVDTDAAIVEIVDDGTGAGEKGVPSASRGNGLRGLRERFAALGGSCEAAHRAGGGFALTASVPIGDRR